MLSLLSDELLSENFLDYKNRGINGSHKGQIIWKIDSSSHFTDGTYFTTESSSVPGFHLNLSVIMNL